MAESPAEEPPAEMKSGINVANLFYNPRKIELSATDYYKIAGDFVQKKMDEKILLQVESFGYNKELVTKCIQAGEINHATATYYLLTNGVDEGKDL